MHTQTHAEPARTLPTLTTELFADILNPDMHTFEVCHRHGLDLEQLRAVTESAHFRDNVDCMRAIQAARSDAMLPAMQARALRTLDNVASQMPTTPTHTETVRRAAAAVLRLKPTNSTEQRPEPSEHPDAAAEHRAEQTNTDIAPQTRAVTPEGATERGENHEQANHLNQPESTASRSAEVPTAVPGPATSRERNPGLTNRGQGPPARASYTQP